MITGVDGCNGGWIAAGAAALSGPLRFTVHRQVTDLLAAYPGIIAIDMPIGLPERISGGGRGPEQAIRPLLGARQSSVFSMPARAAVEAVIPQPQGMTALKEGHRAASRVALALSDPPRAISFQAFNLFPKIRELDQALRDDAAAWSRVFETHPEAVFATIKGAPLDEPKKVKGKVHAPGMAERRALLVASGLQAADVFAPTTAGAGEDDQLDALACLVAAHHIAAGRGKPHPEPLMRDAHGLPIAIWTWRENSSTTAA
jgi:threonine dehydratase